MLENSDTVDIPFQGKSTAHFTLPQAKRGIKSISTPGASPEGTTPGDIPPHSNPEDGKSGASPSGHGDIHASAITSSLASTITTTTAPTAPDTIQDDLQTGWNGVFGVGSQMHHPINPPSGFHPPTVVGGVHETSLEEPVEAGLMSRHASTPLSSNTIPPPYSRD
jgi:hypothetical protein